MKPNKQPNFAKWMCAGVGLGALSYGAYVAATWAGYGRRRCLDSQGSDELLDRFMPDCEVSDRHQRHVDAPAEVTFDAACTSELGHSPIVNAIFKTREVFFGRPATRVVTSGGLVEEIKAFGWGVLAEVPGQEIVFGAVTQPWKADVTFRAIPPEEFAAFAEPGYVKIVWMLRADPVGAGRSIVRTETRVSTTDPESRTRFRWYWSFLSAGIKVIRLVMLADVKAQAERRVSAAVSTAA
jgi:hypothetical protein